jgi:hypothetical protein
MLFADLVDLREGLGAFVVAGKNMQSKGDIAIMLFVFFICVDQCVLSVRKQPTCLKANFETRVSNF